MYLATHRSEWAEIPVSYAAMLVVVPLFATFALYGPVLLARQIIHSGSRGWFVARVFVSILLTAALLAALTLFIGHGNLSYSWVGAGSFTAILYLHWRLRHGPQA
jgi:hypothetical protein